MGECFVVFCVIVLLFFVAFLVNFVGACFALVCVFLQFLASAPLSDPCRKRGQAPQKSLKTTSKPKTKIIELKSTYAGTPIENLAKKNNLNCHSISIDAKPIHEYGFPNQQGSIEIPVNELSEILKN